MAESVVGPRLAALCIDLMVDGDKKGARGLCPLSIKHVRRMKI